MLNRIFVVDSVTLSSTGTAVSSYVPWEQTTRKLPTQVVVKATGQGAYVRLSNDNSAATNVDVLVQGGDHVVLSVQGRRWVSVLSDGASSTVSVGALSTGVSGDAASLSLDFAGTGTLDSRVTFTRASTATRFDQNGVLQTVASGVARSNNNQDYDPVTLAPRGFLIEEQRTNSIRNNTMVGAVAGTPGTLPTNWFTFTALTGLTRQIVGTGTENGITYIDIRLSGTPSAAGSFSIGPDLANVTAAASGQTWTSSYYLKLAAGSLTGVSSTTTSVEEYNSGGSFLTGTFTATAALTNASLSTQRYSTTRTLNQATTAFVTTTVVVNLTGAAIDITLRIGLPQLEQGAFATSVIPTTTTALTRAADVASVNTLAPWYNSASGTLYAEISAANGFNLAGNFGRFAAIQDVAVNNTSEMFFDGNSNQAPRYRVRSGGVNQAIGNSATAYTANTVLKAGLAYAVNDFAGVSRGVVDLTDASGVVPVSQTLLSLGSEGGAQNFLNGWLRRVVFYPRRLSNAELVSITS